MRPKTVLAAGDKAFGFLAGIILILEAIAIAEIDPSNHGSGNFRYIKINAPNSPMHKDNTTYKNGRIFVIKKLPFKIYFV